MSDYDCHQPWVEWWRVLICCRREYRNNYRSDCMSDYDCHQQWVEWWRVLICCRREEEEVAIGRPALYRTINVVAWWLHCIELRCTA